MTRTLRRHVALPVAVSLILVLAACGADTATQTADASAATDTSSEAAPDTSSETVLERVQRTEALVIGTGSYPPSAMVDPESGEWEGFNIDMLSAFAESLGAEPFITFMPASALVPALESGRIDVWVDLYRTEERAEVIDFSETWTCYANGIAVRASSPQVDEATVEGLTGKRLAADRGSAVEAYIDGVPEAEKVLFETAEQSLLEVGAGRVDAAIQPTIFIQWIAEQNPDLDIEVLGSVPVELIPEGAVATPSYFGVAKGEPSASFLTELNAFIQAWRDDGNMRESFAQYGLTDDFFFNPTCED